MDISLKFQHVMALSTEEFTMIGLALAGRLKPEQMVQVRELNRKMGLCRKRLHSEQIELCDGILRSLEQET